MSKSVVRWEPKQLKHIAAYCEILRTCPPVMHGSTNGGLQRMHGVNISPCNT